MRSAWLVVALSLAPSCAPEANAPPAPVDDVPIDAGPANAPERLGSAMVCFAADYAFDDWPLVRTETRIGLTLVAEDARTEPPELFTMCAAGVAETAELIDASGEHLWVGIDAHYGGRELVPRGLLQQIDDAKLTLFQVNGFVPSASLAITNRDQLIVAIEMFGQLRGPFGDLVVENAGGSAPTAQGYCGLEEPLLLRFRDGTNEATAATGDEVVLGGDELRVTNIHSVLHSEPDCDHVPSGVDATWIAVGAF